MQFRVTKIQENDSKNNLITNKILQNNLEWNNFFHSLDIYGISTLCTEIFQETHSKKSNNETNSKETK